MNAKRAPMAPPDLSGFTYVDLLGSGGFADVYLYEQDLPRRRVAVKVLLTDRISSGSVEEFTAEANVMAMLSTHPAIVTIYQAGVSREGRPYLVMEYCPKPNLQVRYRREPFSIAESLRVGVQVAAAVETAHRAGVLHRDIKPANILVTEYNRPALTDFGIASTTAAASESAGLSIPWSPPESFADTPRSDQRSDVYALGATVYSLLAGRSPFELADQRNSAADLIQRIETAPVPPLQRPDAPASLERALQRALARNPADRYDSALAFARSLQKVQIELSHSVTPIDILDDGLPESHDDDEDDGLTRVRGVVSIEPETAPAAGRTRQSTPPRGTPLPPGPISPAGMRPTGQPTAATETVRRDVPVSTSAAQSASTAVTVAPAGAADETILRPSARGVAPSPSTAAPPAPDAPSATPQPQSHPRRAVWISLAVAAVVIVAVIVGVSLPGMLSSPPAPTLSPGQTADPMNPISARVPAPEDLVGTVGGGTVVFTWTNPRPEDGDHYLWTPVTLDDSKPQPTNVEEATATVPADPSGTTCIDVVTVRADGRASEEPTRGCAP